jgi:hypothetical protein
MALRGTAHTLSCGAAIARRRQAVSLAIDFHAKIVNSLGGDYGRKGAT